VARRHSKPGAARLREETRAARTFASRASAGAAGSAVTSVAGRTGAVTLAKADVGLGSVDNTSDAGKPVSTAQQTALDLKAALASPALTGTPTAPTASPGTNTTQLATTAFVLAVRDALLNSAPGALDTLDELAAALGDDASFAATITAALAGKSATSHDHAGTYEPANANIQAHVAAAHAPSNAQKNSDILKAEIEAVLTGAISSHSHAGGGGDPAYVSGSFTVSTGTGKVQPKNLTLSGVERVTLEGTARLVMCG
jgi:hypothetical protein